MPPGPGHGVGDDMKLWLSVSRDLKQPQASEVGGVEPRPTSPYPLNSQPRFLEGPEGPGTLISARRDWRSTAGDRAQPRAGRADTHSETCTKMSSEPFSGVMNPWPCERENCLQTPLNTGPAEARAVLQRWGVGSDLDQSLGSPSPGPHLLSLPSPRPGPTSQYPCLYHRP